MAQRHIGGTRLRVRRPVRRHGAFCATMRAWKARAATRSSWGRGRPVRRPRTGSRSTGHSVLVVDKKRFPREKTCGDGLTPRAVRQLHDMGLAAQLDGVPALRGPALDGPRHHARAALARAPRLPGLRLRGAAPGPRRDGGRPGGEGRGHALAGQRGASRPLVEGGLVTGATIRRARERGHRDGPGPVRRGRRRRQLPVRAGARHLTGTARTRWAWRFAAISPVRTTTSPGSRATSTSGTATATTCPATGGSSRSATAR